MSRRIRIPSRFALLFLLLALPVAAQPVMVEFFHQAGCDDCRKVEAFVLPRLEQQCRGRYQLVRLDIGVPDHYRKLADYQQRFGNDDNVSSSIVVDRRIFLAGYEKIDDGLIAAVEAAAREPAQAAAPDDAPARDPLQARAAAFTFGTVAVAGLIDGINPCVFATLVFFLSLLAVAQVRGARLLLAGSAYCAGCFCTYLALGFGLFRLLRLLSGDFGLRTALEWTMIGILTLFALLSFRDARRFHRSGRADQITLQLPGRIKELIHRLMRRALRYRYLLPGAFGLAMLVTVLESVCTGQVYLPTLLLLTRECGAGSRWFGYLLLYNLMFIVPLLVLFAAAANGAATRTLLAWSKKNVVRGKILLGLFFLALAGLFITLSGGRI